MEKEVKVSGVVLCSGDCSSCNLYEQKPVEQEFVVSKKRVSTHYVVPDMTAIRILGEIEGEKDKRALLSALSQEELEMMRKEKLEELDCFRFNCLKSNRGREKVQVNESKRGRKAKLKMGKE